MRNNKFREIHKIFLKTAKFEYFLKQIIYSYHTNHALYWRFNNYVVLYELQEFKDCENLRTNITKNVIKTSRIVSFSMDSNYLFIIQQ